MINFKLVDSRCPTILYDKDHDRWMNPRRDVGPKYGMLDDLAKLNKHNRHMLDRFLELYKSITAKSVEISKNPLKALNLSNAKVIELYQEVIKEKLVDLTDPVYKLFNITKKIADEVNNATTYSLYQYKKFGKYIKTHTDHEKLYVENAFGDLFEETETAIEPYWKSDKKVCGQYSFSSGFKIVSQLYIDYEFCAAQEINKTDDGINKFLMDLTNFEQEIHDGLYVAAKECIDLRLRNDPVACLNNLYTMDLGQMINKQEVRVAAKEGRVKSVKRVNDCTSAATKKALDDIIRVYQQFVLCFESEQKKKVTSIKGINQFLMFVFEIRPNMWCPATTFDGKSCSKCGA